MVNKSTENKGIEYIFCEIKSNLISSISDNVGISLIMWGYRYEEVTIDTVYGIRATVLQIGLYNNMPGCESRVIQIVYTHYSDRLRYGKAE